MPHIGAEYKRKKRHDYSSGSSLKSFDGHNVIPGHEIARTKPGDWEDIALSAYGWPRGLLGTNGGAIALVVVIVVSDFIGSIPDCAYCQTVTDYFGHR